jgi:hypothetical protein
MVINALYKKYFQKSKIFLYPLLEIKRGTSVVPSETYLSWNDTINSEDMKLVCKYHPRKDQEYLHFERNVLFKHNRMLDFVKISDEDMIVTFDFSDLGENWALFMEGQYSKIDLKTKRKILNFFDKTSGNYAYVESYLFPEKHYETYANILNVPVELLQAVGELCDKPDLDKERLLIEVADLENIKINK